MTCFQRFRYLSKMPFLRGILSQQAKMSQWFLVILGYIVVYIYQCIGVDNYNIPRLLLVIS